MGARCISRSLAGECSVTVTLPLQPPPRESVILVDADDRQVGLAERGVAHAPGGLRHRALSVYLFDADGRLLLQQRSLGKALWAGSWSNSCCTHPRPGEDVAAAAQRRVREELGVDVSLRALFRYEYRADDGARGTEHEVVHVFAGTVDAAALDLAPDEVAAVRWMSRAELDEAFASASAAYTPWFRTAWPRVAAATR